VGDGAAVCGFTCIPEGGIASGFAVHSLCE
jgi:hypothetical protein